MSSNATIESLGCLEIYKPPNCSVTFSFIWLFMTGAMNTFILHSLSVTFSPMEWNSTIHPRLENHVKYLPTFLAHIFTNFNLFITLILMYCRHSCIFLSFLFWSGYLFFYCEYICRSSVCMIVYCIVLFYSQMLRSYGQVCPGFYLHTEQLFLCFPLFVCRSVVSTINIS